MSKRKYSLIRYELKEENVKEFEHLIIAENLHRLKILSIVMVILEILFHISYSRDIFDDIKATQFVITSVLILAIITIIFISKLEKKEKWRIKLIFIDVIILSLLIGSAFITYIRYSDVYIDISLFLLVLFGTNIAIITKPYKAICMYTGVYLLFILLIGLDNTKHFNYSVLFNSLTFIIVAIISSTISYNNQLRIFIKKTDGKRSNEKLRYISITDQLTGLYNRRKIDEMLKFEVYLSKKDKIPLSIIILDIDHFKRVNDNYGHLEGDKILKEIGNVIKKNLRKSDTVGRWGGEEFIIVCINTALDNAKIVAEKLRNKISEHDFGIDLEITASMGVSQLSENGNIYEVISCADRALYNAKTNGRNRVEVLKNTELCKRIPIKS